MSDAVTPEADAPVEPPEAEPKPAAPAATGAAEASDGQDVRENPRKVREGVVISISMDKTAVVESVDRVRHRRYAKTVQRSTKLFAHDEANDAKVGDRVRIQETRPLSKKKRWRLVEIIERAR
jgi:small subunit ribosomal protein S17